MGLIEATESTGFWILGVVGTAMVLIGYIMGKNMGLGTFPLWQLLIIILGIWGASAFFVGRE